LKDDEGKQERTQQGMIELLDQGRDSRDYILVSTAELLSLFIFWKLEQASQEILIHIVYYEQVKVITTATFCVFSLSF